MAKFQCDKSGFMLPMHKARMEWDGKLVSSDFYEPRHPQDTPPTPRADVSVVPNMRDRNVGYLTGEQGITQGGGIIPVHYISLMGGVNQAGLEFEDVSVTAPDGFYPTDTAIEYWCSQAYLNSGFMRLPFAVERMFDDVTSEINSNFLTRFKAIVDKVLAYDTIPIIDMHSQGKFKKSGTENKMGDGYYTEAHFAEFWRKLAIEFSYDSRIEFDIMNEPHKTVLTATQWNSAIQGVFDAIRGEGIGNKIHVELQNFASIDDFFNLNRLWMLKDLNDPYDNWVLHNHKYFDINYDGTGNLDANSDVQGLRFFGRAYEILKDFQRKYHPNLMVHVGEFGVGNYPNGLLALQNFFQYMYEHRDVFRSWTIWGGGPAWSSTYGLKADPPFNPSRQHTPFVEVMMAELPYIGNPRDELYWDFIENKFSDKALSYLSSSRSTTGYAQNKAGTWINFQPYTLRYTDRGLLDELSATNLVAQTFLDTRTGTNNVTFTNSTEDFISGTSGVTMQESGVGSVNHYATFDTTGLYSVGQAVTLQYMYKMEHNVWMWNDIAPTINFADNPRISNPFAGDYLINAGDWKMHHTRGTISTTYSSQYRAKIGFQPDDTFASYSLPDAYTQTEARSVKICCPMITIGSRTQSPIMSASANATRGADGYSFTSGCSKYWGADNFSFVMQVGHLGEKNGVMMEPNDIRDFLLINGITALRKNLDTSIGTDFVSTASTAIPFDTESNFRVPRKIGINIDRNNGKFRFGIEGMAIVEISGTIPTITSMALGGCGGYIKKMRFTKKPITTAAQFTKFLEAY